MKKYILLFAIMLSSVATFAQQRLVVYSNGKPLYTEYTWKIDSIKFDTIAPRVSPSTAAAIDLGLSIKWASFNLGATKASEAGWLVGWADPTGIITSEQLDYYPKRVYTSDIINTDFDIAHAMWGDQWRLPSQHEMEELINNCTWEKTDSGYTVKGANGNQILLPFAGTRTGETVSADNNYYWSGVHSGTDDAVVLSLTDDKAEIYHALRSIGCAVRPVYGEYRIPVSVTVGQASDITINSANVLIKLSGYVDDVTEFGIKYSSSTANLSGDDRSIKTVSFTT